MFESHKMPEATPVVIEGQSVLIGHLILRRDWPRLSLIARYTLVGLFLWVSRPSAYASDNPISLGLPPISVTNLDSKGWSKVRLGKELFFDARLSLDGTISCASCHKPERAFSDGRAVAAGVDAQRGTRNTPGLLNVGYNATEFWDGRRESLEEQALDPLTNPIEHGLASNGEVVGRIRADQQYVQEFRAAFPFSTDAVTSDHVAEAIGSYERTLIAGGSAFDRFFYGKEKTALSTSAQRGLILFRGTAECSSCHIIGKASALFTDQNFHSVNIGLSRIAARLAGLTSRVVALREAGERVDAAILSDPDISELGRFVVTLDPGDIGKFRTPSLRNVALTAPYMHDGSVGTLREAVERELYRHDRREARPLILTPQEKQDLVAFLNALTSPSATATSPRGVRLYN
jgi:cytochrome c peroxidase